MIVLPVPVPGCQKCCTSVICWNLDGGLTVRGGYLGMAEELAEQHTRERPEQDAVYRHDRCCVISF